MRSGAGRPRCAAVASSAVERLELPLGRLIFDAQADGPPAGELVLLLHGFPQTSYSWRHQLPALAGAGYRAVAPDQRGYSPRARPADVEEYRAERLVGDVLGFADALGAGRFHLVGHDWGGAVAWQVAGRHPDRLRTLTVLSTPHPRAMRNSIRHGEQRERSGYMQFFRTPEAEAFLLDNEGAGLRMLFEASGLSASDAAVYLRHLQEPGALTGGLNWYRGADIGLVDGLGPITTPTMYVWSTADPALGREAAEATAACVAGPYRFEVLEGVGHWIAELAADDVNRLLLSHLVAPTPVDR
jgi:pimeloyl-ACP methyl ester carboxylesterase